VIIADIIATKLSSNYFDIIIPRKLGAPYNEELAIGAVMEDGTTYLNDEVVRTLGISQEYIDKVKLEQIQEIKRRTSLYRSGATSSNTDYSKLLGVLEEQNNNRTIILVDDGAATGATLIAAARYVKQKCDDNNNPKRLIIAIPVAPKDTVNLLKKEAADHVEVITSPPTSQFKSVGQYYQSFEPITDEQVIEIMKKRKLSSLL
jgi:putative phosphoribosyl transferase